MLPKAHLHQLANDSASAAARLELRQAAFLQSALLRFGRAGLELAKRKVEETNFDSQNFDSLKIWKALEENLGEAGSYL